MATKENLHTVNNGTTFIYKNIPAFTFFKIKIISTGTDRFDYKKEERNLPQPGVIRKEPFSKLLD